LEKEVEGIFEQANNASKLADEKKTEKMKKKKQKKKSTALSY
jgi:hypothetical protein